MMKNNHTIWGTGQGLLNGLPATTNVPLQIGTGNSWASISAGTTHAFALKSSSATGIADINNQNDFSIYPNPATAEFVTIGNLPGGSSITVLDLTGKTVYRSATNNKQVTVPVSDLVNGVYLIQVNHNGAAANRKFVVNK